MSLRGRTDSPAVTVTDGRCEAVMWAIEDRGPLTVRELSQLTGLTPEVVTPVVKKLCMDGVIERDAADVWHVA